MNLLTHIPLSTPVLAIASQVHASECRMLDGRPKAVLLPAPVHEKEEVSFGVCAPTTSTTVAMAVGDMLALSTAEAMYEMEEEGLKGVFLRNHPGGAIGAVARKENVKREREEDVMEVEVERERGRDKIDEGRSAKRRKRIISPPDSV